MRDSFIPPPRWFTALAVGNVVGSFVVLILVLAFYPTQTDSTLNLLLLGLPAYSAIMGLLAYLGYSERPEIAWVLMSVVWAAFAFSLLLLLL